MNGIQSDGDGLRSVAKTYAYNDVPSIVPYICMDTNTAYLQ